MVDVLIRHAFLVTMTGEGAGVIEDGALAVDGGEIVAVGKTYKVSRQIGEADFKVDAKGKAVLPGLIDAHLHTYMMFMRGMGQDVPEIEWMIKTVAPFQKYLTAENVVRLSNLGVLEGLKAGTTTFGDFGRFMNHVAEYVYSKVGVRANLCTPISEVRSLAGQNPYKLYEFDSELGEKTLDENIRLVERWHGACDGRITCCLGPVAADMLSKDTLLKVKRIAEERDLLIHFHLAQGGRESIQTKLRYGKTTVQFLDEIGFLTNRLIGVHCHGASYGEIKLIAGRGVRMVSCPSAIALIDGIVPPLNVYLEAGGYAAALGTDQGCHNMFLEMRMAALLNKVRHRDPTVLPAWRTLRLVTVDAARCLGLERRIGSIEPGKRADLILVNLKTSNMTPILREPVRNVVPNLLYNALGNEVEMVMVDGQIVVKDGEVLTMNEDEVHNSAQKAAEEIAEKAAEDYDAADSLLVKAMKKGLL